MIAEATGLSSKWKARVKGGLRLMVGNPILPSQAGQGISTISQVFGYGSRKGKKEKIQTKEKSNLTAEHNDAKIK